MEFKSLDGASLDLRILRYQFPETTGDGSGSDWDANWLVVSGEVRDGDRSSIFEDPCLTTMEARDLSAWLRAAANGDIQAAPYEPDNDVRLKVFTEPNVALNLAARTNDEVMLRVYLSLEAQPDWARHREQGGVFDYYLPIRCSASDLAAAAESWEADLNAFPVR
jgi:hypothetical protein